MPHAAVASGAELFHEVSGEGEPLLLIQGMSGTHASWGEPFLTGLHEQGLQAAIYDHRGIGRSGAWRDPFSLEDLADDAVALLDALGWETAHVMGISMGGMVAQQLALRAPERLRTLTLGCTYAGGEGSALMDPADMQQLSGAMMSGDRELALRAGYELNVGPGFAAQESNYAAFHAMATSVPAPLPVIMLQMQAIGAHDVAARLGEITAPTLVVHGTADRMLPSSNGELISSRIPGARLELLDGVGHVFWWEQPARAAALVGEHVAGGVAPDPR